MAQFGPNESRRREEESIALMANITVEDVVGMRAAGAVYSTATMRFNQTRN